MSLLSLTIPHSVLHKHPTLNVSKLIYINETAVLGAANNTFLRNDGGETGP